MASRVQRLVCQNIKTSSSLQRFDTVSEFMEASIDSKYGMLGDDCCDDDAPRVASLRR